MKKLSLLLVFVLMYSIGFGQVNAYTYAYSSGTYTPLSGGTPLVPPNSGLTGNGWFEQVINVPLPFVYYFKGAGYSSVYVNSNGHIAFENPTLGTNGRPHTVYTTSQAGAIMGYGCSVTYAYNNPPVTGSAGTLLLGGLIDNTNANPIVYGTIGTAPNRIFVVQWTNAYRILPYFGGGASYAEALTFQIRLKETSNVAEIVYNTSTTSYESSPYYPTLGLSGSSNADLLLLAGSSWTTATTSASTGANIVFNSSNSIPAGATYTFSPNTAQMPTACSGSPVAPKAVANTGISTSPAGVWLSLVKLPLSTNLTYQWQKSSNGFSGTWTNISGATNATCNDVPTANTYYQCQVACGSGTPVATNMVVVGFESAYPGLPSNSYNIASNPANVGVVTISSASCSTTLSDASNGLGSFNYPQVAGASGTQYAYVDQTASVAKVKLEGSASTTMTYSLSINNSVFSTLYGIWIDFNDNGSFADAGEYIGSISSITQANTPIALTIPANAFGVHRMRIRSQYGSSGYTTSTITPTGLLSYFGQAVDYSVEIVPPTPTPSNTSPVCVSGTLTLSSPALTGATYIWSGPAGFSTTTTSNNINYTVPGVSSGGAYTLLTLVKGSSSCLSASTTATVNPQPSLSGASSNSPVCSNTTLNLSAGTASNVTGYSWTGPVAVTNATTANGSVSTIGLGGAGTYSVAVNNGSGSGCTLTYTTTVTVNASPDLSVLTLPVATTPCAGATSTVTLNSSSLVAGTYQVTYNLSGSNTATGLTAGVTMAGGAGTFVTAGLANAGPTTLTITSIMNAALCSTAPSSGGTIGITVNPLPGTITGTNTVCAGQVTALTDAGGGNWTSGNTSVATVTGVGAVSGLVAGTTTITYTLPTGCIATASVTVRPLPAIITGTMTVCKGLTTALSDATASGTWSSSASSIASVGTNGVVTGTLVGAPVITYTGPNACYVLTTVTVNPLPANITGPGQVCVSGSITLSDATTLGSWTSGTPASATIIPGTGVLSGVLAGTTVITYTLPTGCIATSSVVVNPLPAAITGTLVACQGLTAQVSDATALGSWTSGGPLVATVISGTGVVTGVSGGNTNITYTLPTGCTAIATFTVNPLPATIGGSGTVCEGSSVTLNNTSTPGTWTSSNPGYATIDASLGSVTGVLAGTTTITYALSTGCIMTTVMTVNPLPAGITGNASVCVGLSTSLSDVTPLGTWISSSNPMATVSGSGVVTGGSAGSPNITYKLPTGCYVTYPVVVNPLPAAISGVARVCEGLSVQLTDVTGTGTWSIDNSSVATISSTGVLGGVLAGAANVTYTLGTGCIAAATAIVDQSPAPISGTKAVCIGLQTSLSNSISSGSWSSGSPLLGSINSSGLVSGLLAGTTIVTYRLSSGCQSTSVVTINPLPNAIAGVMKVCEGLTTALSNATSLGSWTSGGPGHATVVSGTGVVTGILAGTAAVTYTLGTGCISTAVVTVNPSPATIAGTTEVCRGLTIPLTNTVLGGVWTSGSPSFASVSGTGIVTGNTAGTAIITYKLSAGCQQTAVVTVDPLPAVITGAKQVCEGLVTNLKDATTLGSWTSSDAGFASVNSSTGDVTGVLAGTANITYTLPTGCLTATPITVNPSPAAITGASAVCVASTIPMFNTIAPGVWSSKSVSLVTVDPVTGFVNGMNPGVANITYTLPAGCSSTKSVTVNALPDMHAITGGGTFCAGDTGAHIMFAGTDTGIKYQVYLGGLPLFSIPGTGNAIDMGRFTTGGAYTASANNVHTGCSVVMPGTAVIAVIPTPAPISGPDAVCVASNITLSHSISGGMWKSSDTFAIINPSSGLVKGYAAGTVTITYTIPLGCKTTTVLTVNPFPDTIAGNVAVCAGASTTLNDATTGVWSSGRPAIATIDATTGTMTGISRGNCMITYTIPATGCFVFVTATVNPLPATITGDGRVCVNAVGYLSDAYAGGAWKTGSNSVATVSTSGTLGAVTGVAQGSTTLTYTLPTGCFVNGMLYVDPLPKAGAITGPTEVCQSKSITLVDTVAGGEWISKSGLCNVTASGKITGAVAGKDTIFYNVTNICGTATAKWQVTVNQCDLTEVQAVDNLSAELRVFPNPSDGVFNVNLVSDLNEALLIEISNVAGQKVQEIKTNTNTRNDVRLNMPAGVYMISGTTAHGRYVAKVVIN